MPRSPRIEKRFPCDIAWENGHKQYKKMKSKLKLSRGTWVAVNATGEYVTGKTKKGILKLASTFC